MLNKDKVRVIRNFCCDKLYNIPISLWYQDLSGVNNITVVVLYNEIKEL